MEHSKPTVGIIGTGYAGLVTGACFAEIGFHVLCLDIVEEKVDMINKANPPIFENGLEELLQNVVIENKLLTATLDRNEVIINSDIIFICLPTPSDEDGSIDLSFVIDEIEEISKLLKKTKDWKTIVVKSTVIPGTTSGIVRELLEKYSKKTVGEDLGLAMNPEFLMEGLAIENFRNPDRIVIGALDNRSFDHVMSLYQDYDCEIVKTSPSGAEMIKYASNSFLATKISFINEIANMCEVLDINVSDVSYGMGLDNRISPRFLRAGVGFGGSCFPKDTKALLSLSRKIDRKSNLLDATLNTNKMQPLRAVKLLEEMLDVNNKTVALLGLAFKPETDDMREAPSIIIAKSLIDRGAKIRGYDPIAKDTAKKALPNIEHMNSVSSAIKDADAAILVTEWNELKELTPNDLSRLNSKIIVDGRRVLNWKEFKENGYQIKVVGQGTP